MESSSTDPIASVAMTPPKRRRRGDRRVCTVNDLVRLQQELAAAELEAVQKELVQLAQKSTTVSRPLKPKERDMDVERRTERIQSYDYDQPFLKKDKELQHRHAREARERSKRQPPSEPATSTLSKEASGYGSDSSSKSSRSLHSCSGTDQDSRRSLDLLRPSSLLRPSLSKSLDISRPNLVKVQKDFEKRLKSIDPKLKAKLRRSDETANFSIKAFLACIIGVLTGLTVQFISLVSTQLLFNNKQALVQSVLSEGDLWRGYCLHAGMSVLLRVISCLIIVGLPGSWSKMYSGCPQAGGAGIPEVKTYLSGALDRKRVEDPRTLAGKHFTFLRRHGDDSPRFVKFRVGMVQRLNRHVRTSRCCCSYSSVWSE